MTIRRLTIASPAALSLLLGGCVTANFKEPVGKFTTAMATANASIGTYFTEMNGFERQAYLKRVLYHPNTQVAVVGLDGKQTGLLPVFSPASIKARLDAISLLTAYGERLAALAGADAPARFEAGSKVLGQNLVNLSATFQKLTTDKTPDPTADKYVTPIATIVGVFGKMVLEQKRDAALKEAVNQGAPAVEAVLGQLDVDLQKVVDPLIETGVLQQLSDATNYYNNNLTSLNFEQRQAVLDQIDILAAKYQAAVVAQPSEAVDGIRDAHAALVKYANSSHKPQDLNALIEAIDTFNNRLEPVVNAIAKLRSEK
jgi:hypothetical protein